jgi:O-acetyl-ADP-ribose deacetylase (regulator of RNase III)
MIKNIDCNLLDADADVIAHCCNCFNTMGSGVARAIRDKYPEAYTADEATVKGDFKKLGTFSYAKVLTPNNRIKYVANIYGQGTYGAGTRQVNYEAIYKGISALEEKLRKIADTNPDATIAFPYKMGSDLAGGDWRIINQMIEVIFEKSPLHVVICKYTPPAKV